MILMTLGWFPFSLKTAPYQQLKRQTQQRWASNQRVGEAPAYQHLGAGDDVITLSGTLVPELTGGPSNLDVLRSMMAGGKAWIMVSGEGVVMGRWFIENIDEDQSNFLSNGAARKIEFSLTLKRDQDQQIAQLGNLPDSVVKVVSRQLPTVSL